MMYKKNFTISLVIAILYFPIIGNSAEFDLKITVQKSSISSFTNTDEFYKVLEVKVRELMNNTNWTDEDYLPHERIKGTMIITLLNEESNINFDAEMIFQLERPVYNSDYASPMFSHVDKTVSFSYSDLQPLNKTTNVYFDNLSSILSFYAYMALGWDGDSFALNGGEKYYNQAWELITSLPSNIANTEGWSQESKTRRNRYWVIEGIRNPLTRQFKQAIYDYHRLGLDNMYEEPDKSRAIILSALTTIGQINMDYPNTVMMLIFSDAKKDEIVEIFKVADNGQKQKVKTIMTSLDFTKKSLYDVLDN